MSRSQTKSDNLSVFLKYVADHKQAGCDKLPPLTAISKELGVSIASIREQLEVARALGLVDVRPRTGIRPLPFNFSDTLRSSLQYAIEIDPEYVLYYSDLRRHLEAAYWHEAVSLLTQSDKDKLLELVNTAEMRLEKYPVQIPQREHRDLHLTIFCRLNNPFVLGLLEAYWDLYESAGLDVYTDFEYLKHVWRYHRKMVEDIRAGNYAAAYTDMTEHMDLLYQRPKAPTGQQFE